MAVASEGGPHPQLVRASLEAASRCCTCSRCKGPHKLGDIDGEDDYLIASMNCRACRPAARLEREEAETRIRARNAQCEGVNREELARSLDVESARSLKCLMHGLSEHYYCAGWLNGLEYRLWRMVQGGARNFGMGEIEEGDVARLRTLAERSGGWWMWRDDGLYMEHFLTTEAWLAVYAEHEAEHPEEEPYDPEGD